MASGGPTEYRLMESNALTDKSSVVRKSSNNSTNHTLKINPRFNPVSSLFVTEIIRTRHLTIHRDLVTK